MSRQATVRMCRVGDVSIVVAQILLVLARPAHAQDVTVLVYALVPAIMLAPLCLALGRWLWLRKRPNQAGFLALLIASALEVLLWMGLAGSVLVLLSGDWNAPALAGPPVIGAILWMMSRIWFGASHKTTRAFFIASAPLVLSLLVAATWFVLSASEL